MDKGSDDCLVVRKEAAALFAAGKYRKALPKIKSTLAIAEKAGDEQSAMVMYMWIIACHANLEEVSAVECETIDEKLTFSSFSQHAEVLRLCDQVEPLVRRVKGSESKKMALLLLRRARAFYSSKRFAKA